jgi:FAD/FMN-containing dehydrogenase
VPALETARNQVMDAPQSVLPGNLLDDIRQVVGDKGWTTDPAEIAPFLVELRGLYQGKTAVMVRPASTEQVAEVVRLCNREAWRSSRRAATPACAAVRSRSRTAMKSFWACRA